MDGRVAKLGLGLSNLKEGSVDVVLLVLGSGLRGQLFQEVLNGGGDLSDENERNQGASGHLSGAVHRAASTSAGLEH